MGAVRRYANFVSQHWAEVKEQNPDATFGEVGRMLGEMWRGMKECEKKKYEE